ncbi:MULTISPECIES: hypothetical protein [Pseudomonas]|uniref:hypothetical protein n=1 Tax=Pseudomonas TaxID=286 RepID=UPI0015FE3700|nr:MULTISPECIES: hypothetical protein [Pseudomonas]MBH3382058.1 hypothetical protein [Pseudomonas asiatica]
MIKFDCAKVSGKLDYVRVTDRMSKGLKATIGLDGQKIPNIQMETEFYEELNEGDDVTLYAIVKNSKTKEKNFGVLYGFENTRGLKSFATKYRWQIPVSLAFYAIIAFAVVFVLGWFANVLIGRFLGITEVEFAQITKLAVVEGGLAAAFFLHAAWRMVKCTADPQSWMVMEPARLATRFSKLHK